MKIETGATREDNSASINARSARIDIHDCDSVRVEHDSEFSTTLAVRTDGGEVLTIGLYGLPDHTRAALVNALEHGRKFTPVAAPALVEAA